MKPNTKLYKYKKLNKVMISNITVKSIVNNFIVPHYWNVLHQYPMADIFRVLIFIEIYKRDLSLDQEMPLNCHKRPISSLGKP